MKKEEIPVIINLSSIPNMVMRIREIADGAFGTEHRPNAADKELEIALPAIADSVDPSEGLDTQEYLLLPVGATFGDLARIRQVHRIELADALYDHYYDGPDDESTHTLFDEVCTKQYELGILYFFKKQGYNRIHVEAHLPIRFY